MDFELMINSFPKLLNAAVLEWSKEIISSKIFFAFSNWPILWKDDPIKFIKKKLFGNFFNKIPLSLITWG